MLKIIGQTKLKALLQLLDKLPGLTILVGSKGAGKRLMSNYMANKYNYRFIEIGNKINDMRILIDLSNNLDVDTLFYIAADEITISASNAILKLAEETPSKLHIVLGVTDINNVLQTLISRANILHMDNYTVKDIQEYVNTLNPKVERLQDLISIANTPGMVNTLIDADFDKCYAYVNKVYDNILKVSTSNSFKIGMQIGFADNELIPVDIFLRIYLRVLNNKIKENYKDLHSVEVLTKQGEYTNNALVEILEKGANTKLIFNIWILNIRQTR